MGGTGDAQGRRSLALELAEEILGDIEFGRLPASQMAKKCARLARLLDDHEALSWLHYEIAGFALVKPGTLTRDSYKAAVRSNRASQRQEGNLVDYNSLASIEATVEAGKARITAAVDPDVSVTSANPYQRVEPPSGNMKERQAAAAGVVMAAGLLERIVGSFYEYVLARYHELRFGLAVETAFETVRRQVDAKISSLIPRAVGELAAALENVASDNPSQWRNAAGACRHLLIAAADALRPPGPDLNGRKMGSDQYINRLVDWISQASGSGTRRDLVVADLEHLGGRLDAVLGAGHKGSHTDVDRFDAARYVTGTYLLLGDLLALQSGAVEENGVS